MTLPDANARRSAALRQLTVVQGDPSVPIGLTAAEAAVPAQLRSPRAANRVVQDECSGNDAPQPPSEAPNLAAPVPARTGRRRPAACARM